MGRGTRRLAALGGALVALSFMLGAAATAQQVRLPPEKDALFRLPATLETRADGEFVVVDYRKERDIHQRDEIPERRAQWKYVSTGVNRYQGHYDYQGGGGRKLRYVGVGRLDRQASVIVIFLHGQNGTRYLGADDWMFGGNFNRIKNMTVAAGGIYLSPDFTDFGAAGAADVKRLMLAYAGRSPGAPIILACGSYGGKLCWTLAKDPQAASLISGMLMMGSLDDEGFFATSAMKGGRPIPIYFGHGSDDKVFDWRRQAAFFDRIRDRAPGYPAKFVLFQSGSHGTPIRMTDWRSTINWMLAVGGY